MTNEENEQFTKLDRLIDSQQREIQSLQSQLVRMGSTCPVQIRYKNHRGEVRLRTIVPERLWYGRTEWYPYPQYLLHAEDVEKGEKRDFAMRNILEWSIY